MDIDNPELTRTQTNTEEHALNFLNQGLSLIGQLRKVWVQAAETQGDTPHQIIEAILSSFNLKGKNTASLSHPVMGENTISQGNQKILGSSSISGVPTIHAPQPTRPTYNHCYATLQAVQAE
ncbi:hypothetical protein AX15_006435 [Amanita polypyramis BW_CC]|nr:hypothetical protein AX15_006435 [Amanita polypyramis BW_CC]